MPIIATNPAQQIRTAGMQSIAAEPKLGDLFYDEVFWYETTVVFTGSDTQLKSIQVQADAHFLWVWSAMNCSGASGAGTFQGAGLDRGGSLVQITDGGTQRALMNAQVPADTIFGSAQRPCVNPLRKLFRANTTIQFSVTDITGGAQTTDYVLGGFKIPLEHGRELGINP